MAKGLARLIHDIANTNNHDQTDVDDDDSTNAEATVMFLLHCQKITHGLGNQNWDVKTLTQLCCWFKYFSKTIFKQLHLQNNRIHQVLKETTRKKSNP